MVNATGAEAIRNRGRRGTASQQKARAAALGYDVTDGDFLPAKNKRFPYYSRARDRDCFAANRDPRLLEPRKPVTRYHRRNDVQESVDRRGIKRTLVIERPLLPDERQQLQRVRRASKRRAGSSSSQSVASSSANSSPSSTLSSNSSAKSEERWFE